MEEDLSNLTLEELNEKEAELYLGGTFLVCILSAIGIVGNIHVLLIYICRMKPSNHRVFIVCLAILDMITCSIGMPFVVINFRKPFTFYDPSICKMLTFYNFFICISSACVLVVIAVDRYRKICVPLGKQMSTFMAKVMCVVSMGMSLLLSWPAIVLYGSTPIATGNPNITGSECNVLHEVRSTNYPLYFNGVLLIVAFSSFIILVALYTLIGRVIWNHKTFKSKVDEANTEVTNVKLSDVQGFKGEVNFHSGSSEDPTTPVHSDSEKENSMRKPENNSFRRPSSANKNRSSSISEQKKRSSLQKALNKFDRTKRTTMMLFWITIVFFISYVPYLTIRIASFMNTSWYPNMSYGSKIAYNTILWVVFINNMANSIIYGFCDLRFRQEIRKVYNKVCCRN